MKTSEKTYLRKVEKGNYETKEIQCVCITASKSTGRIVTESLKECKIANNFLIRSSINDLGIKDKAQLVILDQDSFPNNWLEMISTAKQLKSVKNGALVVMSSFGETETLQKAKMHGADEYILKPFDIIGILQIIKKLKGFELVIKKANE